MHRTKSRIIAGVCGGIAQQLGTDALLVRLAFVLGFLLFGMGPLLYVILWLIVPNET